MEDLTQEEKKKIFKRIIICIILLVAMVILGIVLMSNGNIVNRLSANVVNSESESEETESCDDEITENYGRVIIDNKDDELYDLMPFNIKITNKETGKVTNKQITNKYCPVNSNEDYCYLQLPIGTYDIEISKTGYLNVFSEAIVVDNSYANLHALSLVKGDINSDGKIDESDYRIVNECSQGIPSDICKIADYNFDNKVDSSDLYIVSQNYNRVYVWYKNQGTSRYYGDVTLNDNDFTLSYGQTKKITYTTSSYYDTTKARYFNVGNQSIAIIDQEGNVTPKKPGTTTIYYGDSNRINVTVVETGDIITDSNITINGIETKQIEYNYSDDSTFKESVPTFTSSNTNVITVSDTGLITSKRAGTAIITMKAGLNTTKTINVTVTDLNATDINVSLKNGDIVFNGYETKNISDIIDVTPVPANSTIYQYEYSVEDTDIIKLSYDNLISVHSGNTRLKIKLKDTDVVKYVDMAVNYVPIEGFTVTLDEVTIGGSSTRGIDYEITPANAIDRKITLEKTGKYMNNNIFNVSYSDTSSRSVIYITGQYPGNGTVTAIIDTEDGRTLSNTINVTVSDVPITSVGSQYSSYTISLVGYTYVSLNAYPSNYTKNHNYSLISSSSSYSLFRTGVYNSTSVWVNRTATATSSATITVTYSIDGGSNKTTSFTAKK